MRSRHGSHLHFAFLGDTLPAAPKLVEVADDTFAYLQEDAGWCVNNTGLVMGDGLALAIDTCATAARTRRLLAAIADVTGEPIAAGGPLRYLVNTHFHGDHVFGNYLFPDDTEIIAHEGARHDVLTAGLGLTALWPDVEWGDIRIRPPSITLTDRISVWLGTRRVDIIHVGPAHTRDDVVVWLPDTRTLYAGDVLMNGCTPFLLMGSISGTRRALELIRSLEPQVIVPGHGPLAGPALIELTLAYLDWLIDLAASMRGASPLDIARTRGSEPSPYASLLDPERLVGNLHRAQSELRGEPLGRELDVPAVFREIVAFHGSLPRTYA